MHGRRQDHSAGPIQGGFSGMWVLHWIQSAVVDGTSVGAHLLVFHGLDQGIALAVVSIPITQSISSVPAIGAISSRMPYVGTPWAVWLKARLPGGADCYSSYQVLQTTYRLLTDRLTSVARD